MTLTATNDCGSNTETQQISVACTPPQVSISANGSTQICPGEMVILQINGGNFATFQWYRNGAEIAGANGSSFVAVDAGVYKIFVTDALDCGNFSNEMTVEISQFPAAVITSSSPYGSVCVSASTWLRGVGGDDYQWITPSGLLIGGQEIQIPVANFVSGGIYFLTVTNGAGCAETASFTLSVLPTPQVFILGLATNYTDQDLAVTLVGNPLGGIFSGAGVFAGQFVPAAAGIGQHTISYQFTDANGCTGMDSVVVVVSPFVSTTTLPEGILSMQVLPNPNTGEFWLRLNLVKSNTLKINLLNSIWQILECRTAALLAGENQVFFDKSGLPNGLYFLEINDAGRRSVLRVILLR